MKRPTDIFEQEIPAHILEKAEKWELDAEELYLKYLEKEIIDICEYRKRRKEKQNESITL